MSDQEKEKQLIAQLETLQAHNDILSQNCEGFEVYLKSLKDKIEYELALNYRVKDFYSESKDDLGVAHCGGEFSVLMSILEFLASVVKLEEVKDVRGGYSYQPLDYDKIESFFKKPKEKDVKKSLKWLKEQNSRAIKNTGGKQKKNNDL